MKIYNNLDLDIGSIQGFDNIKQFFIDNKDIFMDSKKVITFDIETKFLNLKDNKLLGFGIGFSKTKSRYIITRDLSLKELKTAEKVSGINLGMEVQFINNNGCLIKKYTTKQEFKEFKLSRKLGIIIYDEKIDIIKL